MSDTTEVSTTEATAAPAPVVETPVSALATEQAAPTTPEAAPAVEETIESYFPKKFMTDGKPDIKRLAQSYAGLEKKLSSKGVSPVLSADEYSFEAPEGFEVDTERFSAFKAAAFEKGMTQEQFGLVMSQYAELVGGAILTPDAVAEKLVPEWGAPTSQTFKDNVAAAKRAFEAFAPSDVSMDDPVFNHPVVMKLLARAGAEIGEDSVSSARPTATHESLDQQIAAIRADPNHINSEEAQQRLKALYDRRYGTREIKSSMEI